MIQLIYTSRSTAADPRAEMNEICQRTVRQNSHDEITGIILLKDNHFLQVLEGSKEAVEETFIRIIMDKRHTDLLLLSRKTETRREFGEFAMAGADPDDNDILIARVAQTIDDPSSARYREFESRFDL
jgi:hypothetical protein